MWSLITGLSSLSRVKTLGTDLGFAKQTARSLLVRTRAQSVNETHPVFVIVLFHQQHSTEIASQAPLLQGWVGSGLPVPKTRMKTPNLHHIRNKQQRDCCRVLLTAEGTQHPAPKNAEVFRHLRSPLTPCNAQTRPPRRCKEQLGPPNLQTPQPDRASSSGPSPASPRENSAWFCEKRTGRTVTATTGSPLGAHGAKSHPRGAQKEPLTGRA